ncbi:MAG: hypothetical protein ACI4HJ_04910 [Ruminococcus sp.]
MAEYIEREALLKDNSESIIFSAKELQNNSEIKGANKVIDRIKAAPTADVQEVKHGKWNKNGYGRGCSECDYTYFSNGGLLNYCPHCGAKMDK